MRSRPWAILFLLGSAWPQQDATHVEGFGSSYTNLRPPQKRLVDDWFERFSAVAKKTVNPAEGYDNLPLSTKTTFSAVTHALLMTGLTDESGKRLGESALDLLDRVDNVAGQILGAGGDQQFRVYVQMRPGTVALLNQSREFKHVGDNTVYHRGYPVCYRSSAGTPSIQISLTRDSTRADIDVDYRSAKFPMGLVNGHLSVANSDIRAEGNDVRHNAQWAGMQNWWRNLLGLPLLESPKLLKGDSAAPVEPKLKGAKPAEAIYEFLNSWLVAQEPNKSIAYLADEAFACREVQQGNKIDRGMARFAMLQAMMSVNRSIGKVPSLSDVSSGVPIENERLKPIENPHRSQFLLYDVREDLAEALNCSNALDATQVSAKAMKSHSFGKYVGAVMKVKGKGSSGQTVATLWRKDHDYWRLISYEVDPEFNRSRSPNVGAPVAAASLTYVEGDQDMSRAAANFLKQWLVKKDVERALEYIAPECLPCVQLYRADGEPVPATPQESLALLKTGMTRVAQSVGTVKSLNSAITASEPHHPDLKLVKHGDDAAFVVVSLPESMAVATRCDKRKGDGDPDFSAAPATGYGKYYAAGFMLASGMQDSGTLWTVWTKTNGGWKISSYVLLTP